VELRIFKSFRSVSISALHDELNIKSSNHVDDNTSTLTSANSTIDKPEHIPTKRAMENPPFGGGNLDFTTRVLGISIFGMVEN
jgi:hypothetical protein